MGSRLNSGGGVEQVCDQSGCRANTRGRSRSHHPVTTTTTTHTYLLCYRCPTDVTITHSRHRCVGPVHGRDVPVHAHSTSVELKRPRGMMHCSRYTAAEPHLHSGAWTPNCIQPHTQYTVGRALLLSRRACSAAAYSAYCIPHYPPPHNTHTHTHTHTHLNMKPKTARHRKWGASRHSGHW